MFPRFPVCLRDVGIILKCITRLEHETIHACNGKRLRQAVTAVDELLYGDRIRVIKEGEVSVKFSDRALFDTSNKPISRVTI